jgi:hypothetical protein
MAFIIGLSITVTVVLIVSAARARRSGYGAPIGWMSEQWLAEYRASHQSFG